MTGAQFAVSRSHSMQGERFKSELISHIRFMSLVGFGGHFSRFWVSVYPKALILASGFICRFSLSI